MLATFLQEIQTPEQVLVVAIIAFATVLIVRALTGSFNAFFTQYEEDDEPETHVQTGVTIEKRFDDEKRS